MLFMVFLLFGGAAFMLICAFYAAMKLSENPLEKYERRTLIFAALTSAFYGLGIILKPPMLSLIAFALYNVTESMMVVALLSFIYHYLDKNDGLGRLKVPIFAVFGIDSIIILATPFTGWAFALGEYTNSAGSIYHTTIENVLVYSIHSIALLILITIALAKLVQKIIDAPMAYVIKYCTIFIAIATIAGLSTFYVFGELRFDYSVLLYSVVGFFIFYYSLIYIPRGLMDRLMYFTISNMQDGIVCIDIDGNIVHSNEAADKYRAADPEMHNLNDQVMKWLYENVDGRVSYFSWDTTRKIDGEKHYFTIEYRLIYDGAVRSIGSFFMLHDRTEEYKKFNAEKYRATHDQLTGLYNKEYFYDTVRGILDEHPDESYIMIVTDVKNFKLVNDVFGVEEGDRLLKKISEITEDFGGKYCVYARLQGDRFALFMPKNRFSEDYMLSCYSKLDNFFDNANFKTHIHIGVYEIADRSLRVSVMCDRANLALRTIKDSFRTFVAYYENEIRESFISKHRVISEFETALAEKQFKVYIQPQVSVNGSIRGGEALVRWIHPIEGTRSPGEFIGILEQTGLICRLDRYVWEESCKLLRDWEQRGMKKTYISINISQKDFYLLDVFDVITKLTQKYQVQPQRLHLEITETALMNNPTEHMKLIERLRRYGFIVEIDDFGSGYSSLNMLKELIADVLKVDMGFLRKTEHPERSHMILRMIINLAKELKMEVITEGVETIEQATFLKQYGCDVYQGYYFAKPMPVEKFESEYLNKRFRQNKQGVPVRGANK